MMIDDEMTERLLRLASPRPQAPADSEARVRSGVHREWRTHIRRRTTRRRLIVAGGSLATAAAVVVMAGSLTRRDAPPAPPEAAVASVEHIEGDAGLARGHAVRVGDWVETGATARAALRLADGSSLRLDTQARARLLSASVIELTQGAIYLDTGDNAAGVEVRTPFGVAHDIGTQFEVRLKDSTMSVRVRSGLVEFRSGAQSVSARPGTEVTLASGSMVTRAVSSFGPEWQWVARLAPEFDIEGRSLAAFLDHLSREQGWSVSYGDAQLARDASGIILHGSVSGLEPRDAVAVALRTSGLSHRFGDGQLVVVRAPARK